MNEREIEIIRIKTKLLSAISKLCRAFHISFPYYMQYGVKMVNPTFPVLQTKGSNILRIDPKELRLGFDFLKDDYTLLDAPLSESPHFLLMESLEKTHEYEWTDYCRRMLNGSLDERPPIVAYYLRENYFMDCYKKCVSEIEKQSYEPVKVYCVNGHYYIYDGKHHSAVAALLKKEIKCAVLDTDAVLGAIDKRIIDYMQKRDEYNKHLRFIKSMKEE